MQTSFRDKASFEDEEGWEEYAKDLLNSPEADVFAKALDACGWMITRKPEWAAMEMDRDREVWSLNQHCDDDDCPDWADNPPLK
jgi:hypothetical protein